MKDWIFLSKDGNDEYINRLARGVGATVTDSRNFVYEKSQRPIVLRGILKYKIMQLCKQERRDFYFVDTGYFGNTKGSRNNPQGWKVWHRIVKNDIQYNGPVITRPAERWANLGITIKPWQTTGRNVVLCLPDEKPMRFYGLDLEQWTKDTIAQIRKHTDRPIVVRERVKNRNERMVTEPLTDILPDAHCVVTFNSNAATESIINGVPAFVLAPAHAARPIAISDLSRIENPNKPEQDVVRRWAYHLAYQQFHNTELDNGSALRILHAH
jgi:hypothetical protein